MREFKGKGGNGLHHQNFLDCVRSRDVSQLNTDVEVGNHSTGWCNLANVAFRAGKPYVAGAAQELAQELPLWGSLHEEMQAHLAAHSVSMNELQLSPILEFNPEKGIFSGAGAEKANSFLKREYRAPYVVPEVS
jgi:hypothetical protein